jgi:phage-related holin
MVELVNNLWSAFRRGSEHVMECWQIKMIFSLVSFLWCYLFGGSEAIFGAVIALVILDTVSKWSAITKRFLLDQGHQEETITFGTMFCGFWYAWRPGYLTSTELRHCWSEKLITYLVLIIAAGVITKLPDIVLFGTQITKSISGGIYACIAVTEVFSIVENLEEMGNKKLAELRQFFCMLINRVTGSNYSVTIKKDDGGTNDGR